MIQIAHPAYVCPPGSVNPARISAGGSAIVGGAGIPVFSDPDGQGFLSTLQATLVDKGMAPAALFGMNTHEAPPWYRQDLPAGSVEIAASWASYRDGVNLGTTRGGLLGLLLGGIMLAALYLGGAMKASPAPAKPAPAAPKLTVATALYRRRKGSRHGR